MSKKDTGPKAPSATVVEQISIHPADNGFVVRVDTRDIPNERYESHTFVFVSVFEVLSALASWYGVPVRSEEVPESA